MFATNFVAAWRMAIVAVLVWFSFGSSVSAQSQLTKPTVSWLASSVPDSARIDLSKIFETNSTAQMRLITQGSCAVKDGFLITTKVGTCKIELRLSSTPKFTAATSVTIIQIKKKTELNVLVTASLANSFEKIGEVFMNKFLNVSVQFNFAGSATLVTQIQQGAPVDIVAMADTINMNKVLSSGDIDQKSISILAQNKLAILVQRGNPQNIKTLSDLTRNGLKVVLCDLAQPCGRYAATVLSKANVSFAVASREASASGVVSRIALGEADAGIAYFTDGFVAGDKVDAVKIADNLNVTAEYPIGIATEPKTKDKSAIVAFIAMTKSSVGRKVLAENGFILP